jgi:hypothetical protein
VVSARIRLVRSFTDAAAGTEPARRSRRAGPRGGAEVAETRRPLPGVESQLKDTEVLFVRHNRRQRAAVTSAKRWGDGRKGEWPLWRLTT